MTTTQITKTATTDELDYILTIDGEQVSHLLITADTRVVLNVETEDAHQGNGYARQLWEAANAEAEVLHQQDHHRTAEGDAFANAVGGDTADETTDYCEHCIICTGEYADQED